MPDAAPLRSPAPEVAARRGIGAGRAARSWLLILSVAGLVVILDQATKLWVDGRFPLASPRLPAGDPGGPTPLLGDLVRIAKTYNDGAIFGLLGASAPVLALASAVVIGAIVWYQARRGASNGPLVTVALGLILGAAAGNLIDRLRLGHVIDWLDAGIGSLRWYTFNVSDAALSVGLLLLMASTVLDRHPHADRRPGGG
jgi:signal peptidase II